MRKAQASMEYLITYGWAVLIMLVVVGALYYLGIFSPRTITTCTFQNAGFACNAYKLTWNTSGASGIILDLAQTTGHDILVVGFNCTVSQTWNETDFTGTTATNTTIPSNGHMPLYGNMTNMKPLPCYKTDGTVIGSGDVGMYYKGRLYIHYWDLETNMDHRVTGDISATVE